MYRHALASFAHAARGVLLGLVVGLFLFPAFEVRAEVVADQNASAANRPRVEAAANGVPVVQIAAPSGAGVSRNQYQTYSVDPQGAILNNSATLSQTQQAGWIQGNPNFSCGQSARVILNEVTSTNPSFLRGYTEVAGNRAEVVIANPNGITCNGCGFINASRGILTTGQPEFGANGGLSAFNVTGGNIAIEGLGLNASNIDQVDLLARTVSVNAEVWANYLNVVTGTNRIDYEALSAQTISGSGAAPQLSLDVSALGGMYANRIRLVGTEAGVGVRNAGQIGATAGELVLRVDGTLENSGHISASAGLHVAAFNLDNTATGEIRAQNTALDVVDTLTNRGLIDGEETHVAAGTLNNIGTGRIYGDHLAIGATALTNDTENGAAAVIAARSRLDIGVQTLTNREHALIFSAGDMAIGGALDTTGYAMGQADTLNNRSATIEALGAMDIAAREINNTNEHFSTQVVELSNQSIREFQLSGSPNRYDSTQAYEDNGATDNLMQAGTPEGLSDNYNRYDYTRVVTETQLQSSDPGKILAGGALSLTADTVLNDKSQIVAGGAMTGTVNTLNNTQVNGEHTTVESGTVTHFYRKKKRGRDDQGQDNAGYYPAAAIQTITLGAATYSDHTPPAGTNLTLPSNNLFRQNPSPTASYLIEADPRFADYRTWLSSDYMLGQLNLDPGGVLKRLGDGFYEQKLIREQILQLTGRRFLSGYSNDEAEYRALMDNGVTVARRLELRPGIALSAEQVAQLTSDIVWLVEREVALPDGTTQKVLMPQVYARMQASDLDGFGALISAQSLDINLTGDLTNAGTIGARDHVSLTAENMTNAGGRVSGENVSLHTRVDFTNLGGSIEATDNLLIDAGRDLNVISATRETQSAQASRTQISQTARLYVSNPGGTLVAVAGRDANLLAAQLTNTGEAGYTAVIAGNNVNVGTITESNQQSIVWNSKNWRNDASREDIGTTIQTAGDIELSAGHDLTAKAANVTSEQGAISVSAAHDIALTAGESARSMDEAHYVQSKSTFSKRSSTTRDTLNETLAQGSTLSGNTVTLQSGNDLLVQGSGIAATGDIHLAAGNTIAILAAQNSSTESHFKEEKKSGVSTSGTSVSVGSSSAKQTVDASETTAAASTVGSVEANVYIDAGKTVAIQGSDLIAGKAIDIRGQEIDIETVEQTRHTLETRETKQRGMTLAVVGTPMDTYKNLKEANERKGFSRVRGMVDEMAASSATMTQVATTFSKSQSSDSVTTDALTHRHSSLTAGGDIRLTATGTGTKTLTGNTESKSQTTGGDINVIGSTLNAGGVAELDAARDITVQASTDQYRESRETSSHATSFSTAVASVGDSTRHITGGPNNGGVRASPYNHLQGSDSANSQASIQTASLIDANSVALNSERGDIRLVGSGVIAEQDINLLAAQGKIDIQSGQDSQRREEEHSGKQLGDLGSNAQGGSTGTSNTVGVRNKHNTLDTALNEQSTIRSAIESSQGNVTVSAHDDLTVQGADLTAAKDLTLTGKNVTLDPGEDNVHTEQASQMKQAGVTASLSGYAIDAAKALENAALAAEHQDGEAEDDKQHDNRMAALYAAKAGLTLYNGVSGNHAGNANPGTPSNSASAAVKLTVSVGSNSAQSESDNAATQHQGSTLSAGQTLTITATGSGEHDAQGHAADGDITANGTHINGTDVTLSAARDITLQSVEDTSLDQSTNTSHNASIGVGFGVGGEQNGFTIELAAGGARGQADGDSSFQQNTKVSASNTLTLNSGLDTNLKGAQVTGNYVLANVGGNLNIESREDIEHYVSEQRDFGFSASLCIPPICYGTTVSASVSEANANIHSTFKSVREQSGIYAGEGGYDITVGKNTDLKGAVIASEAEASKNNLTTATLTTSDIKNIAEFRSANSSLSFSYSGGNSAKSGITAPGNTIPNTTNTASGGGMQTLSNNLTANALGNAIPDEKGSARGTTRSAISPGTVTLTDEATQKELTGHSATETIATLNRDTQSANDGALQKIFDLKKIQQDQEYQKLLSDVAQQAAPIIYKQIGDLAKSQTKAYDEAQLQKLAAQNQLQKENDPQQREALQNTIAQADETLAQHQEQYNLWKEGGVYKIALHALAGAGLTAVTGGDALKGAVAGGVNEAKTLLINDLAKNLDADQQKFVHELASLATGTAIGGSQTGAFTLLADRNNRQLHQSEIDWIKRNKSRYAQQKGISESEAEQQLSAQAFRQVQFGAAGEWDQSAQQFLRQAGPQMLPNDPNYAAMGPGTMFYATPEQKANALMYLDQAVKNADFYQRNNITQPTIEQIANAASRDGQTRAQHAKWVINAALIAGTLALAPVASGVAAEVALFARNPVGYCLGNMAACTVAVDTAAYTAAGVPSPTSTVPTVSTAAKAAGNVAGEARAAQQVASAAQFETQGLKVNPLAFPDGVKLVRELEAAGQSTDDAARIANQMINSGSTLPVATPIDATNRLYKFVPAGTSPSATTPYWFSEAEYQALKQNPAFIGERAGLPLGSQTVKYDVYEIRPTQGAVVFESRVAPTTQGSLQQNADAIQTIVPNRSIFTPPVKIETIGGK